MSLSRSCSTPAKVEYYAHRLTRMSIASKSLYSSNTRTDTGYFQNLLIVGRRPTLSAGGKILVAVKAAHNRRPQSFGDMVLTDRGLTTEIAQCPLGDLTFKVQYPHYIYSSALVKVLWDTCSSISTPVLTCPVSSSMPHVFPLVSKRSITDPAPHYIRSLYQNNDPAW